jgi:hypothetical protein
VTVLPNHPHSGTDGDQHPYRPGENGAIIDESSREKRDADGGTQRSRKSPSGDHV